MRDKALERVVKTRESKGSFNLTKESDDSFVKDLHRAEALQYVKRDPHARNKSLQDCATVLSIVWF